MDKSSPPYEIIIGIGLVAVAAAVFLVASLVRTTGHAVPTPMPPTPPPTAPPTVPPTVTATPVSASPIPADETPLPGGAVPETAPDFTLPRAGGGLFTLTEQLAHGPVVLVFFRVGG